MTSPNYSKKRSELALGSSQRRSNELNAPSLPPPAAPGRRCRRRQSQQALRLLAPIVAFSLQLGNALAALDPHLDHALPIFRATLALGRKGRLQSLDL